MSRRTRRHHRSQSRHYVASNYYRRSQPAPQRRRLQLRWWMAAFAVVVVVAVGGWAVHTYTQIQTVTVTAEVDADLEQQLSAAVTEAYTYTWEVYTRPRAIEQQLPATIEAVDLEVDWLHRDVHLGVDADVHRPLTRWSSDEQDYVIDTRGIVIGLAETEHDDLPRLVDESNLELEVGERVAPSSFAEFTDAIITSDLDIERMRITETTRELLVDVEAGYYVCFNTEESAATQLDNLRRARDIIAAEDDSVEEYIDVRIPYKAYYR